MPADQLTGGAAAATAGPYRMYTCGICTHSGDHPVYAVAEMNLGYREQFHYFQCTACGCLQIIDPPADLARFYPPDYYSFARDPLARSWWRNRIRRVRDQHAFSGRGLLGRVLIRRYPYRFQGVREWLSRTGATPESRILDVGCGRGELLYDMAERGFRRLSGVDPFLDDDLHYPNGLRILRRTLDQVSGSYDLIMLHHSLEHIGDQLGTLRSVARLLGPGGWCLIRIPVVSSHAWERYREKWVQLDAPRHFFLHSVRSLELLARRAGLRLVEVRHDSGEFQFVGSERYAAGYCMNDADAPAPSRAELRRYRRQAAELNARGEGDQAAFYLVAAEPDEFGGT